MFRTEDGDILYRDSMRIVFPYSCLTPVSQTSNCKLNPEFRKGVFATVDGGHPAHSSISLNSALKGLKVYIYIYIECGSMGFKGPNIQILRL